MTYNNTDLLAQLQQWQQEVLDFSLPKWEELPAIELYMDQVVTFLNQRIAPFLGEKGMTASTINNFVRTKVMPSPNKKRYSRLHLAYLIMICTLRQSMGMNEIQQMIPVHLKEAAFRDRYNEHVTQHKGATIFFVRQLRPTIAALSKNANSGQEELGQLISSTAVISVLSKMLTEYLLPFQGPLPQLETKETKEVAL